MSDSTKLTEALRRIVRAPENNLMILHGFVAKYKPGKNNAAGTIDFISMDGMVRIQDIPLMSVPGLSKGQLSIPAIKSDVTVLWKVDTGDATILSFSHIDSYSNISTSKIDIGVVGVKPDNEADYDELEDDGNSSKITLTSDLMTAKVSNKTDTATFTISPEKISSETEKSKIEQGNGQIRETADGSYENIDKNGITLEGKNISLGEGATEPALLGNMTAMLLVDFITACSKITVPTMMGTMPILNIPEFTALMPRCEKIKSQIVKVK